MWSNVCWHQVGTKIHCSAAGQDGNDEMQLLNGGSFMACPFQSPPVFLTIVFPYERYPSNLAFYSDSFSQL